MIVFFASSDVGMQPMDDIPNIGAKVIEHVLKNVQVKELTNLCGKSESISKIKTE